MYKFKIKTMVLVAILHVKKLKLLNKVYEKKAINHHGQINKKDFEFQFINH